MDIENALKYSKENNIGVDKTIILLKYVLNKNFNNWTPKTKLNKQEEKDFIKSINELKEGRPIQYITHKQYFYNNEFYVDENVLIPQPDTEILVNEIIKVIENMKKDNIKVLDLCTGSGAIAISILSNIDKNIKMYASDISKEALIVAYKNEENILKTHSINFIQSDMFENISGKFDIIVSNPPYIKTNVIKTLEDDVQCEPIIALDGGEDGLKYYKIISTEYKDYLNKNGTILLEIGYDQKEEVQKLFKNSKCIKDFSGNDRVIIK